MPILTKMREGVAVWHDVDTDRDALHARWDEWCNDSENYNREHRFVKNSFTFKGYVNMPDGTTMDIHTIVVVYVDDQPTRLLEQQNTVLRHTIRQLRERLERIERIAREASQEPRAEAPGLVK